MVLTNKKQAGFIADAIDRMVPAERGLSFAISGPAVRHGRFPIRKKGWHDNMTPVASMATALQAAHGIHHRYMSMSLFRGTGRTADAFACAPAGWVDLDHNKLGAEDPLKGLDDAGVIAVIQERCAATGLPLPTQIIASGGGHYAIWYWAAPVFDGDLLEEFNRGAIAAFSAFGADRAAWDRARVLRIPGSINAKYDHRPVVRVIHQAVGADGDALRHDFDAALAVVRALHGRGRPVVVTTPQVPVALARGRFAPVPMPQKSAKVQLIGTARRRFQASMAKAAATSPEAKKTASLSIWRNLTLDDFPTLVADRIERGRTDPAWAAWTEANGIPEGLRDLLMVPVHALLSHEVPAHQLEDSVIDFARWIVDENWLRTEWIGRKFHGSCMRRAYEAQAGKKRTITRANGSIVEVDPRYTYGIKRICEIWGITDDEVLRLGLKGLVPEHIKRERWNQRRRTEVRTDRPNHIPTGMTKAELDAKRNHRDAEVVCLHQQGLSIRKIAGALEMPKSTVADAIKRNQGVSGCPEWASRTNLTGEERSVLPNEERVDSSKEKGVHSLFNNVRCAREADGEGLGQVIPFQRPALRGPHWLQGANSSPDAAQVAPIPSKRVQGASRGLEGPSAPGTPEGEYAALRGAYELMCAMEGDRVEIDIAARRFGVSVAVLRAAIVKDQDRARQGRWDWRWLRQNAIRRSA